MEDGAAWGRLKTGKLSERRYQEARNLREPEPRGKTDEA